MSRFLEREAYRSRRSELCRPIRDGFRSYGRAALLSCCSRFLRGTTVIADVATWDFGTDVESPGGMSADSPQACVGAAPGMLLADASPTLDSLCHSAVRVDQLFDHVYGNLNCHGVSRVDQDDHVYGNLSTTPPGLHLPATTTGTTGDNHDYDHEAPNYYYYSNYYHYTPQPLYCCAQGDPMPRASRERSPFFGGHSAGRGGALDFGLRGSTLGGGSRDEWLADKNFSLCRSLASPIVQIPTPYHHSVGAGDVTELLNAPIATCTESECYNDRDTIVAMGLTPNVDEHACGASLDFASVLPVVPPFPFAPEPSVVDAACDRHDILVGGVADDSNAKMSFCSAFDRSGLRHLVVWLQRNANMAARLGALNRTWRCSSAFSGIGCAEMAGSSLRRGRPELHFTFAHAVEKDRTCRAIIAAPDHEAN